MQEPPVNNHTEEQVWWPDDTSQLLIVADFFPEYDYADKTPQA
jgi:hypothetical protein